MVLENTQRPAECTDWLLKSKKAKLSPLSFISNSLWTSLYVLDFILFLPTHRTYHGFASALF